MPIRLKNEPTANATQCAEAACKTLIGFLQEVVEDHKLDVCQFITATTCGLNYSLMPGVIELMAGRKPKTNPDLDTMRFTAIFLHNMLLNGDDHKYSMHSIIEHTTREYAVRYEQLSDIGEAILKRLEK